MLQHNVPCVGVDDFFFLFLISSTQVPDFSIITDMIISISGAPEVFGVFRQQLANLKLPLTIANGIVVVGIDFTTGQNFFLLKFPHVLRITDLMPF